MKYRVLFLFFLMYFLFPENYSKCMGPIGCFNPLSAEYGWHGEPVPSFGFSGGTYRIHSESAYVSSFWAKVNECISYYSPASFTINSGYRCPYYNSTLPLAVAGSIHMYGNAADIGVSGNQDYWMNLWKSHGPFATALSYDSPPRFHVDDRLK